MTASTDCSTGIRLRPEQVAFYEREGYLVVEQISAADELERLREVYDDLFSRQVGRGEGNQFDLAGTDEDDQRARVPQILQLSDYAPDIRNTLAWRNAGRIMEQLLGGEPNRRRDHAILKPSYNGAPTPWHQDEAYWSPEHEHRSLSIWFALQDVDATMGCMQFTPGSHRLDVLTHRPIGNDIRVHGLELDDPACHVKGPVSCPLRAGSCTVHGQRTLHYTAPNRSDRARRAWIMMGEMETRLRTMPRRFPWQEVQQTSRAARAQAAASTTVQRMTARVPTCGPSIETAHANSRPGDKSSVATSRTPVNWGET